VLDDRRWFSLVRAPRLAVVSTVLAGGACTLSPDTPEPSVDDKFRACDGAKPTLPAPDWWRGFALSDLDALLEVARQYDFDIAGDALLPTVGADVNGGHDKFSPLQEPFGFSPYQRPVQRQAKVDFWRKNRVTLRAAKELASASRFDQETVTPSETVSVADTDVVIVSLKERLRITSDTPFAWWTRSRRAYHWKRRA
jgi:outer membrane protein TolC